MISAHKGRDLSLLSLECDNLKNKKCWASKTGKLNGRNKTKKYVSGSIIINVLGLSPKDKVVLSWENVFGYYKFFFSFFFVFNFVYFKFCGW